jgi:hypothetical protein
VSAIWDVKKWRPDLKVGSENIEPAQRVSDESLKMRVPRGFESLNFGKGTLGNGSSPSDFKSVPLIFGPKSSTCGDIENVSNAKEFNNQPKLGQFFNLLF